MIVSFTFAVRTSCFASLDRSLALHSSSPAIQLQLSSAGPDPVRSVCNSVCHCLYCYCYCRCSGAGYTLLVLTGAADPTAITKGNCLLGNCLYPLNLFASFPRSAGRLIQVVDGCRSDLNRRCIPQYYKS